MPTYLHPQIGLEFTAKAFPQYEIGKGTYSTPKRLHIVDWQQGSTLRIGAYTSLAQDVTILLGGEHRIDWVSTYPFTEVWAEARHFPGHPTTKGDVVIGNDVWIGLRAMILSGTTIGDGAVIAAGSVVAGEVPPYTIAAGNPARPIRKRFDEPTIERLQKIRWWHWQEERIQRYLPLILNGNMSAFLDAAENDPSTHSR